MVAVSVVMQRRRAEALVHTMHWSRPGTVGSSGDEDRKLAVAADGRHVRCRGEFAALREVI